jgi:uncharacterized protein
MPFKVLSIDGGGMRGLYSAAYLNALEETFCNKRGIGIEQGLDIGKAFNLIVGTSTGAIIGCGLATGIRPSKMAAFYENYGYKIFPQRMPSSFWGVLIKFFTRSKYLRAGNDALIEALTEVFEDTTIIDVWAYRNIALAINAINMINYKLWIFKTPHLEKSSHRDDHYKLADICLASSAAPLFRSLAALDTPGQNVFTVFADGGLCANNPVLVALAEALRMTKDTHDDIEIYCLGSCGKKEGKVILKEKVHRGFGEWKFGGEAAKISVAAQENAFDFIATALIPHLNKKVSIIRFPTADDRPDEVVQYLDLDETREDGFTALKSMARIDSDSTNSLIMSGDPAGLAIEALFNSMPIR